SLAEGIASATSTVAAFSAAGNVLAYRVGAPSLRRLTWYDRAGRQLEAIAEPGFYENPSLGPDDKSIAVNDDIGGNNTDVWILDSLRNTTTRFTFDPAKDVGPAWSSDGKRIAFGSNRSGRYQLYARNSDGSGQDELMLKTEDEIGDFPLQWTADGRYLL